MIASNTVQKVAKLSRISQNLSPEELQKYTDQLSKILGHVEEIQSLNTSGVAPTDGWRTNSLSDLRPDTPPEDLQTYCRIRNNILNNFPIRSGDYCVVNNIFAGD
jgi:aspartyl/glutamyl-tRNA(Asn/Gln) amidotransferase C subunit